VQRTVDDAAARGIGGRGVDENDRPLPPSDGGGRSSLLIDFN
jgi:hypothetical protein